MTGVNDFTRTPPQDLARRTAYNVLHATGADGAYAHIELPQQLKAAGLDQRDAGFVTELVNGVLRWRLTLDAVLQQCSSRPLIKIDPRVLDVLRMGAYQLLFLDTGSYAAVDTSVDLVSAVAGHGPKGFVNAILRKVSQRSREQWFEAITRDAGDDLDAVLSLTYSQPRWIVSALRDALGRERASELADLLAACNTVPHVTLVARPGRSTLDELLEEGAGPGRWSPYAAVAPPGSVGSIAAVRDGSAGVQDEGSQLVAIALANAPVEGSDERWLDECAGPGGKFALLAALASQRGAEVTGIELHEHRVKLMEQMVGRSAGAGEILVGDAREVDIEGGFDRVLLDAPCTGLGVLRRRPEIRWNRQPSDLPQLGVLQSSLLNRAIDLTRPGGVIGYVTCSPHIAETDLVIKAALRKRGDIELEDARALFPGVTDLGDGPYVRLWPHTHGTDGMFFALLRKA